MAIVEVGREACIGCGVCAALCSEVFEIDEENKSRISAKFSTNRNEKTSTGKIPPELLDCVKSAMESCPVSCISVKDEGR
ncbi:MAG: ferredoxin [Candidatus Bathyarchaeia archaeon]